MAERLAREALADRRDLPPGDSALAATIANLANIVRERGRLEEADSLSREALRLDRLRHDTAAIATSLTNLSAVLWRRGQHDEARTTAEEGVALSDALGGLGQALLGQGRDQDALASLERSLKIRLAKLDTTGTAVAVARRDLGICLTRLGRYEEAERLLTASYPVLLARFGETHWSPKIARDGIAELGRRRGRPVAMPAGAK